MELVGAILTPEPLQNQPLIFIGCKSARSEQPVGYMQNIINCLNSQTTCSKIVKLTGEIAKPSTSPNIFEIVISNEFQNNIVFFLRFYGNSVHTVFSACVSRFQPIHLQFSRNPDFYVFLCCFGFKICGRLFTSEFLYLVILPLYTYQWPL